MCRCRSLSLCRERTQSARVQLLNLGCIFGASVLYCYIIVRSENVLWNFALRFLFPSEIDITSCGVWLYTGLCVFGEAQWKCVDRSVCCMLILKSLRSLPLWGVNGKSLQSLESVQKWVSTATEPQFPSCPSLSFSFPPSLGVMCKCAVSSFWDLHTVLSFGDWCYICRTYKDYI